MCWFGNATAAQQELCAAQAMQELSGAVSRGADLTGAVSRGPELTGAISRGHFPWEIPLTTFTVISVAFPG